MRIASRGKLLLIVGEMDTNVPPESTMRLVDALIKAGKDFELLVVPNANHGMGGAYGQRRMQDFFVRHLLHAEPPDRNAPAAVAPGRTAAEQPASGHAAVTTVTTPPESFFALVRERDRDAARKFYKKYVDVDGMPVVASSEVADLALTRTREIVNHMLAGRPDVVRAMVKAEMYLIVIGKDQVYTDMPEYRNHPDPAYQNERVRGTGGRPTSFGEENVLSLPLDRYDDESIAVHEFSHTIDGTLHAIDAGWAGRLDAVYKNAIARGRYKERLRRGQSARNTGPRSSSRTSTAIASTTGTTARSARASSSRSDDPEGYDLVRTTFNLTPGTGLAIRLVANAAQCRPAAAEARNRPLLHQVHLGARVSGGRPGSQRRGTV